MADVLDDLGVLVEIANAPTAGPRTSSENWARPTRAVCCSGFAW
jgi:hypothetical protein